MIRLFGDLSLLMALLFALLQASLPLIGYWRRNLYLLAVARPAAWGQAACVLFAYALLTLAFGVNDFSIAYVAANSHPLLPLMYRLTAVWGAHEGSILLWIFLLNGWTIVFALSQQQHRNIAATLTLAVLGLISCCFLLFLIFTSNPFLPADGLLTGNDLNPLLQDPGLIIHPPMLYIGYVGLSVAFAITMAALLCNKLDKQWAYITRQFATAAWCFLTFGIALGSWWAYRVLGWGGFWFWDPVENASLLPWLAGTAFIHVMLLAEKRGGSKIWASLLAIICFALSLLGTFLVRSGVLVSAHTFASDPQRGVFLLLLLTFLLTASLILFVIRLPSLTSSATIKVSLLSRDTMLMLNSALLFLAMLTVLLGTLYPLITDALHLGIISVGAPYFNMVMLPIVFVSMLLMGLGSYSRWREQNGTQVLQRIRNNAALSILIALGLLWGVSGSIQLIPVITLTLSVWIMLSILPVWRLMPSMSLTHAGFAILIIGIMLSSTLNQERNVRMNVGDTVSVGPYQFIFLGTQGIHGSNYRGIQAGFDVTKGERHIVNLYPEKRIYTVRDMVMTKVAIHAGIFRDLYIALGEPLDNNEWTVRIYYKPFIRWIWAGGILMMLGGLLSITKRARA